MAHLIGAEGLGVDFGTGPVLDGVTLGLEDGDRIGVVGANGAGKSTLISILAGLSPAHTGRVTRATGVRVGVVDQGDAFTPGATVLDAIVGDAATHEWAGDPRVRDVMSGLVPDLDADALVGELSGGQRRRVALARTLVADDDVLVLDEPTNHLDIDGVAWLAEHIKRRWAAGKGALVVVTHDRWFLDEVTTNTWEVVDAGVEQYEGGYAAYVLQRVERNRISAVTEQRRQNLLRKELAWLRRGAPARTSKPKFRIDAANELIADVPEVRDPIKLQRMAASRLGKEVVSLVNAHVTYPGTPPREVLRDVTWLIGPGERTGILGPNGAGKSTLLKLITGELEATKGHVKRGTTVRVAALSQHLAELEEWADQRVATVLKQYASIKLADGTEVTPGQLLERVGFNPAQLKTQVSALSGGQRRRLQILVVLLSQPNVLVLDEPTNDLDTDMLAALEDLLDSWPGTLIVVSHDRYLMERITDQQYAVMDGGLRHLPGGVDEYIALAQNVSRSGGGVGTFGPEAANAGATTSAGSPSSAGEGQGLGGADLRATQKEIAAVERRLKKVLQQKAELNAKMTAHDPTDYPGLAALAARLPVLDAEASQLEERWLELSEQLGH
ncbi:ABC-F family ATP-binding cassette domain-containing protein [Demequina sp. TTPB684]|uniref:ABC-F family ATP-binding cassette domain-containing protein n=1 Tax=unclassified Demequina TaxID=2620311 RepID=UPI001CF44BCC|nr:ABC-F family ATP-binding cassette domain-containing protein [Demequina sp. TMPB413]MCB2411991.1 ABC-F family ATP-binding cassette domain-containing protein [Demequina sp. TTPB684]UPU88455.1 ABC-F family ATP-binding cassette domain-containing protein [Demequina sp. TMPB413]